MTWRALFCYVGLLGHAYQRYEQYFPGRRKQSIHRPADPPGWGYVLTWLKCPDCGRTRRVGARECWETDYFLTKTARIP